MATNDSYDINGGLVSSVNIDPAIVQQEVNEQHRAYLKETDWYIWRYAEVGTKVPTEVLAQRQLARTLIIN